MSTTLKRTDIHRPSAINPADYEFVGVGHDPEDDPGAHIAAAEERRIIQAHMKRTGGKFSSHEHGGSCHVCGAHFIYYAVWYHPATNVYLHLGFDCTEKLWNGDANDFRPVRSKLDKLKKEARDVRENRAGKLKAEAILSDAGLSRAWELYDADTDELVRLKAIDRRPYAQAGDDWKERGEYTDLHTHEYSTLRDIVRGIIKRGYVTEKQEAYLRKLLDQIDNKDARDQEREDARKAEHDAAKPCPSGRVEIEGTILSIKTHESVYGVTSKCLIRTVEGWKAYGTVPSALWDVDKFANAVSFHRDYDKARIDRDVFPDGIPVKFRATVSPSRDDEKFGFFTRPHGGELIAKD